MSLALSETRKTGFVASRPLDVRCDKNLEMSAYSLHINHIYVGQLEWRLF